MKVFIAGPRALKSLNGKIEQRLTNIVNQNITVLVGDANGIDKSTQEYFNKLNYQNVIVYASQGKARNNLGGWSVQKVDVDDNIKGFDFYAAKDLKMAEAADYGFMIWNGKSKGTLNNIINLTKQRKKVLLFFTPHKDFYTINSLDAAEQIVSTCGAEIIKLFKDLTVAKRPSIKTNDLEQLSILNDSVNNYM